MRFQAIFLLIFFPIFAEAQNRDEQEILKILEKQTISWNKGNLDSFMVGYWENDSLMYIGGGGVTYGYRDALKRYKNKYSDTAIMGKLNYDILHVKKVSPEYYFVVGKWYLKRSIGDVGGVYTLLFRKINGKWVIIADHSS